MTWNCIATIVNRFSFSLQFTFRQEKLNSTPKPNNPPPTFFHKCDLVFKHKYNAHMSGVWICCFRCTYAILRLYAWCKCSPYCIYYILCYILIYDKFSSVMSDLFSWPLESLICYVRGKKTLHYTTEYYSYLCRTCCQKFLHIFLHILSMSHMYSIQPLE